MGPEALGLVYSHCSIEHKIINGTFKLIEEIWTQNNCQKSFVFNLLSQYFAYKAFSRLKDAFTIEHQQTKNADQNEQIFK